MKTKALIQQNPRIIVLSLFTIVMFSLLFYFYAINRTVRNIVHRQNIEKELAVISARIGELEFKYISLNNSINFETAESMGFVVAKETKYVSRKSSVAVLSPSAQRQ